MRHGVSPSQVLEGHIGHISVALSHRLGRFLKETRVTAVITRSSKILNTLFFPFSLWSFSSQWSWSFPKSVYNSPSDSVFANPKLREQREIFINMFQSLLGCTTAMYFSDTKQHIVILCFSMMQGPRFSYAQGVCVADSCFFIYEAWFCCCSGMHSFWYHVYKK